MIQQSETIAALGAALAKAQAVMEGAAKDRANPAFKGTKYADLSSVWEACREPLASNGLSVVQFPGEVVDGRMTLTTQLVHSSGEWMRSTMAIPLPKADPQGAGSALTYARRYALAAVVGVCPEDDDGNAASRPADRREPPRQQDPSPRHDPPTPATLSGEQRDMMMTMLEKTGADVRAFCQHFGIESVRELPAARFDEAFGMLDRKAKKAAEQRRSGQKQPVAAGGSDILDDEVPY